MYKYYLIADMENNPSTEETLWDDFKIRIKQGTLLTKQKVAQICFEESSSVSGRDFVENRLACLQRISQSVNTLAGISISMQSFSIDPKPKPKTFEKVFCLI